jgi:hypothetical protein
MSHLVDIFEKATVLIESGWTQKTSTRIVDGRLCYCSIAAICYADPDKRLDPDKKLWHDRQRAFQIMKLVLDGREISNWNDDENRKHEEVIAKFKEATEVARKDSESG